MRNVRSCSFATSNEDRLHEVCIEYNPTLWQSIFKKPGRVEYWVRRPVPSRADYAGWYNKETKEPADTLKSVEIMELMEWMRLSCWSADDRYSSLKASQ